MDAELEGGAPTLLADARSAPPVRSASELWSEPHAGYARSALGKLGLVMAALFLGTFVVVALLRLRYPFELEWIEGGLLDAMRRVRHGQGLYVPPTLEYVPFIYNPLYFWVTALFSFVFGEQFLALRLVSLLASLATLSTIAALVKRETGSWASALLGAGLYAATFKLSIQFMDLARVDALFVCLLMAAVWAARRRDSEESRIACAGLLILAFLTKQSGVLAGAPLIAFLLWDGVRGKAQLGQRVLGALPALFGAGGIGVSVLSLQTATDGWYRYYAFELPSQHVLVKSLWVDFWTVDLMAPLGFSCLAALFVLLGPSGLTSRARVLWGAALLGVLMTCWSSRLHDGGWNNVLMPCFAVIATLAAVGVHAAYVWTQRIGAADGARARHFVQLAVVLQLAMLVYDPRTCFPSAEDERAGWQIVETLRKADGDVFVPTNSYLATMAGKPPHLHEMAVRDVVRGEGDPIGAQLKREIATSLRARRWQLVITDNDFFAADVLANYDRWRQSVRDPRAFFPVTGAQYRTGWMFRPKR